MVQASHPTTEWTSLQDIFYRRTELYALNWGIDNLADYVVAASSNGGLIALIRDPTRLVSLGKASLLKPKILVYTAAGQLIESIPWDPSLRIIALDFNALEQLVVVLEEGNVRLYTLLSPCPVSGDPASSTSSSRNRPLPIEATSNSYYTQHSLGTEATETGILDARIWAGGLVAFVGARRFVEWRFPALDVDADAGEYAGAISLSGGGDYGFALPSFDDDAVRAPAPELLPPYDQSTSSAASSSSLPPSWAVVPPNVSHSGLTTVLIAQGPTLLSLTRSAAGPSSIDTACQDMRLSRGPFHAVRPSPNGKLLALLTADLILWVVSSDFSRSLSEFDIRASEAYEDATPIDDAFRAGSTDPASAGSSKGGIGGSGVREVQWCGNNTIALSFNDEVVMVGPFGDNIRYPYSGPTHLVGEVDGVRIIASDRHEFLQKVSDVSSRVFRPGSNDPAALLFEAAEQFSAKSSRADEGIRAIRSSLPDAVDCCLRAAAYEWDLTWQKRLLKAASFGKSFIELYDPTSFVEMARTLRVLNAARNYQIGIPISYEQYVAAGPTALLSRLTAQNHHFLSLKIARFLHIRPDPILKHWARAKIARTKPALGGSGSAISAAEERLCADIVHKFRIATTLNERTGELDGADEDAIGALNGGDADPSTKSNALILSDRGASVSFAEVAWTAWKAGRGNLATRLLDHEARAIDQVPLLLNMREDKLALVKAIESGDTDLIYHVLLRLKNQLSRGDFFRIIQAPVSDATVSSNGRISRQYLSLASNLLEAYAKEVDRDLLKDFYYQDDRRTDSAILALQEANSMQNVEETELPEQIFKLKTAMKFFGDDKERVLEAKLVDEQIRLLAFQWAVQKEDGGRSTFTGLSLNETIRQLLFRNMAKKAEKLRSDFKVPDKRYWNIKLDTLVQSKDWDGLWSFAQSKRSPIGYTPFVVKLVEHNHVQESMRFVPKIQDKADRNAFTAYVARLPNQATANQLMDRFNE
ncbi:Vps16, C-terminal [Kalmanozyma brasiliensis GHG001]|uniref:Vps16, C-terminal n=1 Tax=Kalmanozyma brasiliensis (strain GHG001) TaxID=1365824 RepID=UPI002867C8AF|nr:Vps16, C-terminal [Kalmanozyma brasiliensis GHG001]EST04654.2 Vps16, C-terminal [Kalmanozyma brasiliensis GHG001]